MTLVSKLIRCLLFLQMTKARGLNAWKVHGRYPGDERRGLELKSLVYLVCCVHVMCVCQGRAGGGGSSERGRSNRKSTSFCFLKSF